MTNSVLLKVLIQIVVGQRERQLYNFVLQCVRGGEEGCSTPSRVDYFGDAGENETSAGRVLTKRGEF